jgi:sulfotransferase
MISNIHFISGLPRSGSTLLASILSQNPRFVASMTGPTGALFNAMLGATSPQQETSIYVDDAMRERLLHGVFDAVYADAGADQVIFDTNRAWTTKLSALVKLFPKTKMICCVRNPAWIVDSIETLIRKNAFELSGIFNYDRNSTVYSRVEALRGGNGMIGFSISGLREAIYGGLAERLMLVRYESLMADPQATLSSIYEFIGEPLFAHDLNNVESNPKMLEFDKRLGTPGLHSVRKVVESQTRETILPPDLFSRIVQSAFWDDKEQLPAGLRVV